MGRGLLFLDRDGVLNEMVVDPEHGTIDSPLRPEQVRVFPFVPLALKELQSGGFDLVIVTNQPAAAKGKTTLENLTRVHECVVREIQSQGATILGSEICFHRAEDGCECRKPKAGMLKAAWTKYSGHDLERSWMVGDGITDVQAGSNFGVKTVFLGPKKSDIAKVLDDNRIQPTLWTQDLRGLLAEIRRRESI